MRSSNSLSCSLTAALALWSCSALGREIRSRANPDVKVSFKETTICETTPGVKAYAGYVTLPSTLDYVQPYEQNMFFWFFESRSSPSTAPLSIWLQGGPGAASIDQAVSGHSGPCIVNPDSRTTRLNPDSWTSAANMLYIDQPVQTGFSYDVVTDGVLSMLTGDVDVSGQQVPLNWTAVRGKFSSMDPTRSANSTLTAARAVYHLLQAWFDEFAQYKRDSVSIWSQSYGGHYAPAIASLIQREQKSPGSVLLSANAAAVQRKHKRQGGGSGKCNGTDPSPHSFGVDSVGIINGLVDVITQLPFYPSFAINNTYGIQAYPMEVYEQAMANLYTEGACMDQALACKAMQEESDAQGFANNATVVEACGMAFQACWGGVYYLYDAISGRDPFDIMATYPISAGNGGYAVAYLNQPEVQEALGAKTNYTASNNLVSNTFIGAGDFIRSGMLAALAGLVDEGIKVSLIYGDRDFRCNWVAGEAVSLAVNYSAKAQFAAAGYADLSVGGSVVGKVRQQGLYSFSRIYNAGHDVPSYKPAVALEIFKRTLQGKDLATGQVDAGSSSYATTGPASVFDISFPAEPLPSPQCHVVAAPLAFHCTEAQIGALLDGSAVVEDYVVVQPVA